MADTRKSKIIVNPAAGRGNCGRMWPEVATKLRRVIADADISFTQAAGDEIALARDALRRGYNHFVAVGGDGTFNGILNGVLKAGNGDQPPVTLSPVPAGTANELARELGYHDDVNGAVEAIAGQRVRILDLLEAKCTSLDGEPITHYGNLAISWGAAAEISYRTSTSRYLKKLGGRFSYYAVTLIVTLSYPNHRCRLDIDGRVDDGVVHYTGLICNTEVMGGGMKLAPNADPEDGIADLVLFRDIHRRDILLQKPSWLFEGHHVEHEKIDMMRGRTFRVDGAKDSLIDADGETIGRLPLAVRVLPRSMSVTC